MSFRATLRLPAGGARGAGPQSAGQHAGATKLTASVRRLFKEPTEGIGAWPLATEVTVAGPGRGLYAIAVHLVVITVVVPGEHPWAGGTTCRHG